MTRMIIAGVLMFDVSNLYTSEKLELTKRVPSPYSMNLRILTYHQAQPAVAVCRRSSSRHPLRRVGPHHGNGLPTCHSSPAISHPSISHFRLNNICRVMEPALRRRYMKLDFDGVSPRWDEPQLTRARPVCFRLQPTTNFELLRADGMVDKEGLNGIPYPAVWHPGRRRCFYPGTRW